MCCVVGTNNNTRSANNNNILAIAIAVPIGVALLAALIAGFAYMRKKRNNDPNKKTAKKAKATKSKTKADGFSDVSVGAAAAAPVVDESGGNDPANPKQYTVNIDYLMTGAKRGLLLWVVVVVVVVGCCCCGLLLLWVVGCGLWVVVVVVVSCCCCELLFWFDFNIELLF
jgi:hypothetical protein